jgi:hypothetical protein
MSVRIQAEFPRNMRWPNDSERGRVSPEGTIDGLVALYTDLCPTGGKGVEVGCWSGESAEIACQFLTLLVCIDPWEDTVEPAIERLFDARTAIYPNVLKIKRRSTAAATLFDDNTFDVVYLDGLHDEANVRADIWAWLPKIKAGGWISGHDYNGVRDFYGGLNVAVDSLLGEPAKLYSDSSWAFCKTPELVARMWG